MSVERNIDGDRLEWPWLAVALVGATDCVWARRIGFHFKGLPEATLLIGVLLAIGFYYGTEGRNRRLRDLGHYLALWLVFPVVLNIYSYLAAAMRFPLCDVQLSILDESIGFHWLQWAKLIHHHRTATTLLFLSYNSIFIQGFATVAYFALTNNTRRNRELLWITMIAGSVTVAISGFIPALGPMTAGHLPEWTSVLLKVRDGSMTSTALWDMKGIVAFPSFHTVLGLVFVYVHRPPCKTFIPVTALNALMLISIPFMGHHYLTDTIAGTVVTILAIVSYRIAVSAPAREYQAVRVAAQSAASIYQVERP